MENSSQLETGKWAGRFFTIWTGQALSLFGSALVQFALIWWLTQKSGSATVLAIATLVGMLPQIVIGPFASQGRCQMQLAFAPGIGSRD